jgi:N-acyl-phosphatidylethanolamine-hydrolysing phospholipase D
MTQTSRSHFDHLDLRIIPHFSKETQWIVPEGVASLLVANGVQRDKITELSWWQKMEKSMQVRARKDEKVDSFQRTMEVTATPSMHWTGRNLFDVNQSL